MPAGRHSLTAFRLPFRLRSLSLAIATGTVATLASPPQAQTTNTELRNYDLPAGPLATTLNRIAVEAGITLSVEPALVQGRQSSAVRGRFDALSALREALRGTGLELTPTSAGSHTVIPLPEGAVMLQKVTVQSSLFDVAPEPVGMKADYQSSATKSTLSIRETPQAITVVTRDSMDRRQVRDLTSALELTAGLVPSSSSTIGGPFAGRGLQMNEEFSLRGQDLNGQRDIRVDGFALSSPKLDLVLFDRVEVVKGPSSMLYGQGSLGGFINFIRKKPQTEARTTVVGQAGSWDTYRAELDTTGALTDGGELSGRFVAAYDDAGSFIDGVWTKSTVLAPNFDWQITDQTRLYLDLIYQDADFSPSHGVPLRVVNGDQLRVPDIPRSRMTGEPPSTDSYSDSRIATARVDHQLSDDWLVTLALQGGNHTFGRFFDNYAHGGLDEFGNTSLYADTYTTDEDFWATELRVDGRFDAFGREHQVLLGVERNRRTYDSTFAYQYVGVGNIYADDYPSDGTRAADLDAGAWSGFTENTGAYAQAIFGLTERIKLLAGVRYDEAEQTTDADDAKKDDVTTRVGLTYELASNMTAYASYGESFSPVEEQTYDHRLLDPKTGKGYELGVKSEWFDGRLGITLALYRQELNNVPIPDPAHADGSISGGEQRNDGVEIEVAGSPLPGLDIVAGYGWVDSEFTNRHDPAYGLVPYGTIEENAGISVSYELQNGALRGLGAGITYTYIGERSFAYAGLVSLGYVDGATSDQLWFDGFERTDLNLFYTALENWDISLQVRNLFDDTYIERMRDVESNNYFGSPRAYLLRIEYTL